MKIGYVYDPVYLRHDTGNHVESIKRLETIMSHLEKTGLTQRLTLIKPRPATVDEIAAVHRPQYIAEIRETARAGGGWLDPDTVMSAGSYEAAIYAAGGVITAAEAVVKGEVNSAFALVRPPGHHATAEQAMGFCLFNNVAIAARYALNQLGVKRIAIIDFDVHHGNGTQEAFYHEPRAIYLSTHQYPYYPGTGSVAEIGKGMAKGNIVNMPMPSGCGDKEYEQVFEQIVAPVVRRFAPQLILVSAGYDPHWADQLAIMQMSVSGFARMAEIIRGLAEESCGGKMVFTLEGGYNLAAQAASVASTFMVLLGEKDIADPIGPSRRGITPPDIAPLIEEVKTLHGL